MKYLLWFYLYVLNNDPHFITTYVMITKDSIRFYVYDYNYVNWKIDQRIEENHQTSSHNYGERQYETFSGRYIISLDSLKGYVYITSKEANITVLGKDFNEHIRLHWFNRKKLKRLKK